MKIFETLQELINYIPNCIICGKEMKLSIEGYSPTTSKWSGIQRVYLKLELKDDILYCKQKNFNIALDITNNKIIDGEDIINRLLDSNTNIKKCCSTCSFKSLSIYQAGQFRRNQYFPPLTLQSEHLDYTMSGSKRCRIIKYYVLQESEIDICTIYIDSIALQPIPLEFAKFSSLEQINNKIKTIITFQ